ncbi:putative N-acetyltransferase YjcF [Thalassovita gelatinovora]|uniref:Putative N-acetyltransferase YjcF n=1 Tax=Thalassovita gelatinovora TaxID=53501 RepID=A0A0P1F980_THAGE|nr:GNAT family N-acetyltransferase [Thalassovita gelatinovora]QIZ81223.1 GNAT family N-acetyltransferase [Thalassovita gelatinovora]CUH64679.1 putative N-acetyltransferase YjcF [Thalassovita gelatinovora]SEP93797.1 Acetyltransferase (GNAT) domain-containing protein [Thalassovita gelatinovora]
MNWTIAQTKDIAACHALRRAVFIDEQGIAEADEWDDLDQEAVHLLASIEGVPVGTARLLTDGTVGKIGRVCVVKSQRGTGLGAALVQAGIDHLSRNATLTTARLGAQEYAIGFYKKLGFAVCGPVYDDAGIPHRDMERPL